MGSLRCPAPDSREFRRVGDDPVAGRGVEPPGSERHDAMSNGENGPGGNVSGAGAAIAALAREACVACRPGAPGLSGAEVSELLARLDSGWTVEQEGRRLVKSWRFRDFAEALVFVNRVGDVAEAADHHPDIAFGWGRATITLWTHAIGGLHRNDFIVAARIEALAPGDPPPAP